MCLEARFGASIFCRKKKNEQANPSDLFQELHRDWIRWTRSRQLGCPQLVARRWRFALGGGRFAGAVNVPGRPYKNAAIPSLARLIFVESRSIRPSTHRRCKFAEQLHVLIFNSALISLAVPGPSMSNSRICVVVVIRLAVTGKSDAAQYEQCSVDGSKWDPISRRSAS